MGEIAIVTGAMRLHGIGAAVCRELGRKGIDIFLLIGRNMIKQCLGE